MVIILRSVLQLCILALFGSIWINSHPMEPIAVVGLCSFFGLIFLATFLLGTGAAEKLTERKIFLAFESAALLITVSGMLSITGSVFLTLVVALVVWWGVMLAVLVHPAWGDFREEKEIFRAIPFTGNGFLARVRKCVFAFLYAPIFVRKEVYFWGAMAVVIFYFSANYLK